MRRHIAKHKHLIILTAILMFASMCAGAVNQTRTQLDQQEIQNTN